TEFNEKGFDKDGNHKNGSIYDDEGLDKDGFDNSLDTLGLHTSDDDLFY
ncbi:MAG: hypothetical protein HOB51_00520, partial [Thaumarchaeota archaeon]|nr:hypothetical protein [Nitrososphaerota archaeon]